MSDENVIENESEETIEAEEPPAAAEEAAGEAPGTEVEQAAGDAPVAEVEAPEPEPATPEAAALPDETPAESVAETAEAAAGTGDAKPKKKRLPRAERPQRAKRKREKVAERKPIVRLPKTEHARGRRRERQGTVVSAAADKTIVVRVDVVKAHPTYKKVIKRSTRLHAHDERNEAKPGDIVRIVETRPLSKLKRWRLQEIVEAAK